MRVLNRNSRSTNREPLAATRPYPRSSLLDFLFFPHVLKPPIHDFPMTFVDISPRDGYKAPTNTCEHPWKLLLFVDEVALSMDADSPQMA